MLKKKLIFSVIFALLLAAIFLLGSSDETEAVAQSASWYYIFPPDGNYLNLAS